VVKEKEGYRLQTDFYSGGHGMNEKIGQNGDLLSQEYFTQVAMKDRFEQGYRVTRTTLPDGDVMLLCQK
jgi:hypothetical protein